MKIFIENLVKTYFLNHDLKKRYREMSKDSMREKEADEWTEVTCRDSIIVDRFI